MAVGTTLYPGALDSNTVRNNTHEITSTIFNDHSVQIEAIETKLGTGASTATANTVLRGTGAGATAFGQIVNADITDTTITNAKISATAAIVPTKLATNSFMAGRSTTQVSGTFTDTFTTIVQVSITTAYAAHILVHAHFDGRSNTKSISMQGQLRRDTTVISSTPIASTSASGLRQIISISTVDADVAAGAYTYDFQVKNSTDTETLAAENMEISVLAVPSQ